jgi:hypothetical protein
MQHGTKGLSDNAGAAVFLHLWSGCHRDMKIMNNISSAFSEPRVKEFLKLT